MASEVVEDLLDALYVPQEPDDPTHLSGDVLACLNCEHPVPPNPEVFRKGKRDMYQHLVVDIVNIRGILR